MHIYGHQRNCHRVSLATNIAKNGNSGEQQLLVHYIINTGNIDGDNHISYSFPKNEKMSRILLTITMHLSAINS